MYNLIFPWIKMENKNLVYLKIQFMEKSIPIRFYPLYTETMKYI